MLMFLFVSLTGCVEYGYQLPPDDVTPPVDTAVADTGAEEPIATAPVYANTSEQLYEIDPATGAKTLIGGFTLNGQPIDGMVDIAIDLNGHMYGGTFDALYRIDPTTAVVAKVCDTELRPYAMAFTSDGVLFAGAGTEVVSVNLGSCAATSLATSTEYETSGDLVGLPDGNLYWTVEGNDSDELVRVNPTTGQTTWIGRVVASDLFGLGYDEVEDELYGFSQHGEIVRISPVGAQSSITVVDATVSWWGATTNPVVWD